MTLQKENEKLRELLREAVIYLKKWNHALGHQYGCEEEGTLIESIDSFLSQQAEPAPAQDERDSFKRYKLAGEFCVSRGIDDDSEIRPKIIDAFCSGYACAGRPMQTEQQPVAEVLWPDEPGRRGGFSQIGHYDDPRLPVGAKLYAAHSTQGK